MKYNYIIGDEVNRYQHVQIPKVMLVGEEFRALSLEAKVLYAVFLDRTSLSKKNGWRDKQNRNYIIYKLEDIQEDLGFGEKRAIRAINELKQFGLIEKKRRGHGLADLTYVKSFVSHENEQEYPEVRFSVFPQESSDKQVLESTILKVHEPADLPVVESPKREVLMSHTKENHTNLSHTIYPSEIDEMDRVRESLKENIDYDVLMTDEELPKDMLEEIVNLLEDTLYSRASEIRIGSAVYPREVVKSRLLKLDSEHIKYVIYSLKHNRTEVRNIRAYLLAALYNAPATMESYYSTMLAHHTYGDNNA